MTTNEVKRVSVRSDRHQFLKFPGGNRVRILLAGLLLALLAPAGWALPITWLGNAGDLKWSSAANWDFALPASTNDLIFGDTNTVGSAGPLGVSNNVVDTSVVIHSLQYGNLNTDVTQTHNTYIPAGVSLSIMPTGVVSGPLLFVGSGTASGGAQIYATISGPGSLVVSNTASAASVINVRQGNTANNGCLATLDLSGLNSFSATVNRLLVGGDGTAAIPLNREHGVVLLAKTNVLSLSGSPGMTLGYDSAGANNDSGDVQLGQTNLILSDAGMSLGLSKGTGSMEFQAGLSNPVVVFRNLAGTGRQANWLIGDASPAAAASTSCSGTLDFTLGTVNALVDTVILGRGQAATAAGTGTGTLLFSAGVLDVNNMTLGTCNSGGNRVGGNGFATVNGPGQLIVNGDLQLGMFFSATTANNKPTGQLTVQNGGSAWVKGNVIDGASPAGTTAITVNFGTLKIGGQIGRSNVNNGALENLTLIGTDLTLNLNSAINSNNPICRVTNLFINAPMNLNVQGGGFGVGQYPLIQYLSGSISGDGFPVVTLGSLPPRAFGYLSNNVANNSIDLVITNISSIKWNGNVAGGNWDTNGTLNWKDTVSGQAAGYLETIIPGDTVLFDDSATGTTTVNLANDLSPTFITVSNANKSYTFKGPGSLTSSAGGFTKTGNATLIITNSGANAFGGAFTINGGTVQLGLAPNRLPTTANVTIASVAGAGLDLGNQNQALNSLTGGGTVALGTGNLQTSANGTYAGTVSGAGHYTKVGSGNQIFSGANTYQGGTTINGGVLTLDNASGSGLGTGPIEIGLLGTLSIGNNSSGGSVPAGQPITNNGVLTFNRTTDVTVANPITGTGAVNQNNTNTVTLTGSNSYSGLTSVNLGPLKITDAHALGSGTVYVANVGIIQTPTSCLQLQGGINVTNPIQLDQKNASYGVVPAVENLSGVNTLSGPMSLFIGGSYWHFQVDSGKLNITGPVANLTSGSRAIDFIGVGDGEWLSAIPDGSGSTSVNMSGTGTWTLSGTNTYFGPTSVNSGTLRVNGEIQSGNPVTVYSNATLAGTGVIASPVEITTGGNLALGSGVGTLTLQSSLLLDSGSTTVLKLNAGTGTNDTIVALSGVTYGGNLVVTNFDGTPFHGGQSFVLFSAGGYGGAFDTTTLPVLGAGLTWDTSTLMTDGTLRINGSVSTSRPSLSFVSGNSGGLTITWPADHTGWRLQGQTNGPGKGLTTNWFDIAGSTNLNQVVIPIVPANGSAFFRLVYP